MNTIKNNKIAVIGLDCKFPGSSDGPGQFWETLLHKKDGIVPIPADRWDHSFYYNAAGGKGKTFVDSAGFISGVFDFSPSSFGMSAKEAADTDPQQRLLIQASWNSIQNAGYKIDAIKERTGVFFGLSYRDYYDFDIAPEGVNGFTAANPLGTTNAIAAGRVAYVLGLNGPAIQLDTICSSSLMTLHLACQSLLSGECDYALSGGVNCILSPHALVALAQMGALSKSARCQAFSKHADGYIRGEGVGVLLLKRLEDAERDGDYIYGVVAGTATNHDGRSNGLTAPNGKAQVKLMQSCLEKAGLAPGDIGYVEAHGTGTYLGDPVELEGLQQVFGASHTPSDPLHVGSVKSNIGHLEPAAGVASLIKSLLILKNGIIPAGLHLEELNPGFKWAEKPILPVKENRVWQNDKKFIGVSAFSMTGANVHAILGKAPVRKAAEPADVSLKRWPLLLTAQSESTLKQYCTSLLSAIDEYTDIAALSNTLLNGREMFEMSIYGAFENTRAFILELNKFRDGLPHVFEQVVLEGKRKSNSAVLKIANLAGFQSEYLQHWKEQRLFTPAITKVNGVLEKLTGKSLDDLAANPATGLEQKILCFAQAYLWAYSIAATLKPGVQWQTSGEGDYLGAVFSEVLTIEEALLLFILEDGPKRNQLLDRIKFHPGNNYWDKSGPAGSKAFWLHRQADNTTADSTLSIFGDTRALSMIATGATGQLQDFLLYGYAKGLEVDWTKVLGNKQVKKIALPPTPLVVATYVSDSYKTNSRKAPGTSGNNPIPVQVSVLSSILHRQADLEQDNRKSFTATFSPEQDLFIRDHKVNGAYIFPGSGYIAMVCEALVYLERSHQIRLDHVQIFQPMRFDVWTEKRTVKLDLTYALNKGAESLSASGSWEIKSRKEGDDWTLHIKGGFGLRAGGAEENNSLFALDEASLSPVDTAAFYDHLNKWGVTYGAGFRLVEHLASDERSMKALVRQGQSGADLFAAPELLDACMHALFSAKMFDQYTEPFVPARYEEINFYRPLRGRVQASGVLLTAGTDAMNAQFLFCDPEGKPILEIKSMEIRRILSVFLQAGKEDDAVYDEQWKKLAPASPDRPLLNSKENPGLNDTWLFLDAGQAQQAAAHIATAAAAPQIVLIGPPDTTASAHNITSCKDIASLVAGRDEGSRHYILFAPPIHGIEGLSPVFALCGDLLVHLPKNGTFRLCTINGAAIPGATQVDPFHTALWGLARTMPIEAKQKWKGVIDIASINDIAFLQETQSSGLLATHDQLVLRDKTAYTPVLAGNTASAAPDLSPAGDWADPVLITGGLGQMGRVFTEQLVKLGCKKIYLLSRNPAWLLADDKEAAKLELSSTQLDFRSYVAQCESEGISISAVSGKVDNDDDMAAVAAWLKEQGITALNLIHAAGAITRSKVLEANPAELEREWRAKYEGALLLDKHFNNFKVGFTLYTSSIASLWSGDGVAGYASANLLLDGLAINRNLEGKRTLSARFGRFTEKGLMKDHEAQELEASGILAMPIHTAVDKALQLAASSALSTPAIMQVDWARFTPLYQLLNHNEFLSSFTHQGPVAEHQPAQAPGMHMDKPLPEIIRALVAAELEIDILEVDPSIPLFELGLDSMHSLGIRTDLEKLLNIKLSVSLIYDYNTVDLLSKHLESLVRKDTTPAIAPGNAQSEAELLQLLMQELN